MKGSHHPPLSSVAVGKERSWRTRSAGKLSRPLPGGSPRRRKMIPAPDGPPSVSRHLTPAAFATFLAVLQIQPGLTTSTRGWSSGARSSARHLVISTMAALVALYVHRLAGQSCADIAASRVDDGGSRRAVAYMTALTDAAQSPGCLAPRTRSQSALGALQKSGRR